MSHSLKLNLSSTTVLGHTRLSCHSQESTWKLDEGATSMSVPKPQGMAAVAASDWSPGTFKEGPKDLTSHDPSNPLLLPAGLSLMALIQPSFQRTQA